MNASHKRISGSMLQTAVHCQARNIQIEQVADTWLCRSKEIAQRVLWALKSRKMMQKELALTIGFRPQQVSRILKGDVNLTIKTIAKLEAALGISLFEVPVEKIRRKKRTEAARSENTTIRQGETARRSGGSGRDEGLSTAVAAGHDMGLVDLNEHLCMGSASGMYACKAPQD